MDTMRTEDDHMADDNPFGIDEIDDQPQPIAPLTKAKPDDNPEKDFVDVLPGQGDTEGKTNKVEEEMPVTLETANNYEEMSDEELGDWEMIEYEEAEFAKLSSSLRAPDFLNDPFKDKWKNTVDAYTKKSRFGHRRTYALKPMMVKANDDCR